MKNTSRCLVARRYCVLCMTITIINKTIIIRTIIIILIIKKI